MMLSGEHLKQYHQSFTTMSQKEWAEKNGIPLIKQDRCFLNKMEKLKTDRTTILLDTGAIHSVVGTDTLYKMHDAAIKAGQKPSYTIKDSPLHVHGVGAGYSTCKEMVDMPIAIGFENRKAEPAIFRANIAEGLGKDLPAIMGNKSMAEHDAVILMREGQQYIAFPGPQGYKIEWSPGTKLCPIQHSKSGHLLMEVDHFEQLEPTAEAQTVYLTTDNWKEQ